MAGRNMEKLSGVDILKRRKGLLVTPEICTGCRGCQSACKEWNKLPAEKTRNRGSYENPKDLSPEDITSYARLREITWSPVLRKLGHPGGHTGWVGVRFLSHHLLPLLRGEPLLRTHEVPPAG